MRNLMKLNKKCLLWPECLDMHTTLFLSDVKLHKRFRAIICEPDLTQAPYALN